MAEEYWYCLKHHTVEPREGCKNADRLGPYPTREDATRALENLAEDLRDANRRGRHRLRDAPAPD